MVDKVRVRLVPRTRDGRSVADESGGFSTANAKANRPDPDRAAEAAKVARDLGLHKPRITYGGSLDATLPPEQVEDVFRVSLEKTSESLLDARQITPEEVGPDSIDINTASAAELEALPEVGTVLAERIIDDRERAPFTRLEQLQRIRGISRSMIRRLRPMIATGFRVPATPIEPRERIKVSRRLQVPTGLRDLIAFAYIPTPVEFFTETFIPPDVENYNVRLADVANALHVPASHRNGWTGRGVRIAMTDTGFAEHPFFERQGYHIERASTPSTQNPAVDTNGHGTGESANALFMAPDVVLIGVKHNDYSAEALETALQHRPDIITNSWGWSIDSRTWEQLEEDDPNLHDEARDLESIINDAVDDGVLVVFAAGNGHLAFPASMPAVLSVGGVTVQRDGSLEASSYASSFRSALYPDRHVPDVCGVVGENTAPNFPMPGHIMLPVPEGSELEGENMPVGTDHDGWGVFSGTSAAAPQIAGIAALLRTASRDRRECSSPADLRAVLQGTAIDITTGTTANGDTATVGDDDATGSGFVNAAEACATVANGVIELGIVEGVTNEWRTLELADEHGPNVAHLAAIQTFDGPDPAGVRLHRATQTGFRVKIEDEQSKDAETHHNPEKVGHVAVSPGLLFDRRGNPIGEVGMIELDQPDGDTWHHIGLLRRYDTPVVVAQIMTYNAAQPAHTRIRDMASSSFEIQIEEWDYLNGVHPWETVAFLVVEGGRHEMPGGLTIEAGVAAVDHTWVSVAFETNFNATPVVLSGSQTYEGDHAVVTRHRVVGGAGFDVRLQEEEGRDGWHRVEDVGWVALNG